MICLDFVKGFFLTKEKIDSKSCQLQDNSDTQCMRQAIQVIINYRTTTPAPDSDPFLPDALNNFYECFDVQNDIPVGVLKEYADQLADVLTDLSEHYHHSNMLQGNHHHSCAKEVLSVVF